MADSTKEPIVADKTITNPKPRRARRPKPPSLEEIRDKIAEDGDPVRLVEFLDENRNRLFGDARRDFAVVARLVQKAAGNDVTGLVLSICNKTESLLATLILRLTYEFQTSLALCERRFSPPPRGIETDRSLVDEDLERIVALQRNLLEIEHARAAICRRWKLAGMQIRPSNAEQYGLGALTSKLSIRAGQEAANSADPQPIETEVQISNDEHCSQPALCNEVANASTQTDALARCAQ